MGGISNIPKAFYRKGFPWHSQNSEESFKQLVLNQVTYSLMIIKSMWT